MCVRECQGDCVVDREEETENETEEDGKGDKRRVGFTRTLCVQEEAAAECTKAQDAERKTQELQAKLISIMESARLEEEEHAREAASWAAERTRERAQAQQDNAALTSQIETLRQQSDEAAKVVFLTLACSLPLRHARYS